MLESTLQDEGNTDKKLTKLARSVINLRAKKLKKPVKEESAVTATIKGLVKKVTG